ncbi:phosphopantetheine binding protein [Saccharothrix saharensis]|uniref:Phosphopantetheine binding protein n=1 Tax=Saccharothrix saharensis TaxID=571190 RepID=A0A543JRG2_9PSEU|nr:condensation domain-containing protein [Saccharothrix saharensis]TQM85345.1 phosphopantetheine binding protein [Saccharothrix saharensis]
MRYPLSFAQAHALSLPELLSHATWLDGPVDPVALQRAMDVVVARHPTLRTSVTASGEQVVSERGGVVVEHVVLPDDVERAESTAAALVARPFELHREPLLRAAVIEVRADRFLFVLVAHRVIADASALGMLLADLSTAYREGPAALQPSWMDYGDYAVWQRERLDGEELARQLEHWREVLRDAPAPVRLPAGHPAARSTAVVDPAAVRRLSDVADGIGATPSAAFLAAYAVVLSRYARRADLVVGIPVSGRVRVELEPIAGPFADVVPVRVSLEGDPAFGDLLLRVRDAVAHAVAHDEVPLTKLAAELGADLSGARFTFGSPAVPSLDLPGVTVRSHVVLTGAAEADLDLRADGSGTLTLEHRTDPRFADWVLRSVVAVLEHAAADTAVAELPVPAPEGDWSAGVESSSNGVVGPVTAMTEPGVAEDPVPSRDRIEETMAGIWAELLRTTEPIGRHDNLFGLGSGSLTAVRFAARIADLYGVTLPMDRIVTSPTIAALAEVVSAELAPGPPDDAARDAALADLSDDELDDLLRAVVAARDRRRTTEGDLR